MNKPLKELRAQPATHDEYLEWTKTFDGQSQIPDSIHAYVSAYLQEKIDQMDAVLSEWQKNKRNSLNCLRLKLSKTYM